MKNKLTPFGVFSNQIIGTQVKASDINDLLENRMTKRQKKFWSSVQFKDQEGRTICITREFLDDQGMTIEEIIQDWIEHGDTQDEIRVLNPKGSGTITL